MDKRRETSRQGANQEERGATIEKDGPDPEENLQQANHH
jgi:hypothetical protein